MLSVDFRKAKRKRSRKRKKKKKRYSHRCKAISESVEIFSLAVDRTSLSSSFSESNRFDFEADELGSTLKQEFHFFCRAAPKQNSRISEQLLRTRTQPYVRRQCSEIFSNVTHSAISIRVRNVGGLSAACLLESDVPCVNWKIKSEFDRIGIRANVEQLSEFGNLVWVDRSAGDWVGLDTSVLNAHAKWRLTDNLQCAPRSIESNSYESIKYAQICSRYSYVVQRVLVSEYHDHQTINRTAIIIRLHAEFIRVVFFAACLRANEAEEMARQRRN